MGNDAGFYGMAKLAIEAAHKHNLTVAGAKL